MAKDQARYSTAISDTSVRAHISHLVCQLVCTYNHNSVYARGLPLPNDLIAGPVRTQASGVSELLHKDHH